MSTSTFLVEDNRLQSNILLSYVFDGINNYVPFSHSQPRCLLPSPPRDTMFRDNIDNLFLRPQWQLGCILGNMKCSTFSRQGPLLCKQEMSINFQPSPQNAKINSVMLVSHREPMMNAIIHRIAYRNKRKV